MLFFEWFCGCVYVCMCSFLFVILIGLKFVNSIYRLGFDFGLGYVVCVMFYFIGMILIIVRWLKWVFVNYFVLWVWEIKWLISIIWVDVEVSKSCYDSGNFLLFIEKLCKWEKSNMYMFFF